MTEREYRAVKRDSYSTLKVFSEDRKKYYRKFIMENEDLEDEDDEMDTKAVMIGELVHCLELNPDEFDNKFYISACSATPPPMMLKFIDALYKRTREASNDRGVITTGIDIRLKQAYDDVKFDRDGNIVAFKKQSFEKAVIEFDNKYLPYFEEMLAVKPTGKKVIFPSDYENAERVGRLLRNSRYTGRVMTMQTDARYIVQNEVPILFTVDEDMDLKSMIDKVIIDKENKTIQLYDIKITWNVDRFIDNYYLYRKAYLQAATYYKAARNHYHTEIASGYQVLPMKFIVADSIGYMSPLIYSLSEDELRNTFMGFTIGNTYYKGWNDLIKELKWHKEAGIWDVSKENYQNDGIIKIGV